MLCTKAAFRQLALSSVTRHKRRGCFSGRRLPGGVLLVLVVAALVPPAPARACSEVLLGGHNDSAFELPVSARNYDYRLEENGIALPLDFIAVQAGHNQTWLPTADCTPSTLDGGPTTYGFVCMTVARDLAVTVWGRCRDYSSYGGVCVDGMNDQGLSVGVLVDRTPPPLIDVLQDDGTPAISWLDLPRFILSYYATVEEVERDFVPGRVQLLASPVDPLLARDHYSLADATGAAAVIEFTGPDTWEVRRNPLGILTNSPQLPQQYAWLDSFRAQQLAANGPVGGIMFPGFCGMAKNITDDDNRACNAISRFTTLAMLKEEMARRWGKPGDPRTPSSSPDPANPALIQALLLLNMVTIPGEWPANNSLVAGAESTIVQLLRDHTRLLLHFRTMGTLQWVHLDLRSVLADVPGGQRVVPIEALSPATVPWSLNRDQLFR